MTRYLIPATLLALIAALFFTLRPESPESGVIAASGQRQGPRVGLDSPTLETAATNASRTKSKIRTLHPKPTFDETVEMLKNTIIPKVDIEDQTLSEATATLNTFINDAGIPPHQLKVIINNPELFTQWRIRELRIREVPLAALLKYICDSTTLRYRVEPGIIRFCHASKTRDDVPEFEQPTAPDEPSPDSNDPFADSPIQLPNPIAEPNSPGKTSDPFAEPAMPSHP